MPIKRLRRDARTELPSMGELRKGGERPEDGRRPGQDLDYWRFTSEDPEIVAAFEAEYGTEPQAISVMFPNSDIDDNWEAWQEEWNASALIHRCDGETCVLWLKPDGTYSDEPKPCPSGCKPSGQLRVLLPDLYQYGYVRPVRMLTHSIHDILTIEGALAYIASLCHGGDLRGARCILQRVPRSISTPGKDGKRARRQKWLIQLVPDAEFVRQRMAQLEAKQYTMALPSGPRMDVDAETGEILELRPGDDLGRQTARERMGGVGLTFDMPDVEEAEIVDVDAEEDVDPKEADVVALPSWALDGGRKFEEFLLANKVNLADFYDFWKATDFAHFAPATNSEAFNKFNDYRAAIQKKA